MESLIILLGVIMFLDPIYYLLFLNLLSLVARLIFFFIPGEEKNEIGGESVGLQPKGSGVQRRVLVSKILVSDWVRFIVMRNYYVYWHLILLIFVWPLSL